MRSAVTSNPLAFLPQIDSSAVSRRTWYVGDGVCALADSERHLGHAVKEGDFWIAYDAVHPNLMHKGFLVLGRFKSILGAIQAIESSLGAFETRLKPAPGPSTLVM
jgi:hypothetical protein